MSEAITSIAELLASLAGERDRVGLSFYRGKVRAGRMTYGELLDSVERLAGHLEERCRLRAGDRVLILSPNRLEIPTVVLALLRLGAVVVPLNPSAPPEDWSYSARHSGARGAVGTPELLKKLRAAHAGLEFELEVEHCLSLEGKCSSGAVDGRSSAIVLYTSGTTGNPKGVELSQANLLANGRSMAANFGLDRTTQFAVLPLYHAHALGFGLMTALSSRGHLVFTDQLDPFAWSDVIRAEAVAVTSVVPTLLPMLMSAKVHRSKVPTLKAILVSSAPLTAALARDFEAKTELTLIQGWGLSEYTNFACCLSPGDSASDHQALLLDPEIPSVGSALPGTDVRIVDEQGHAVKEGAIGELQLRGPSLMRGYFRDPAATEAALADGWLRTGDQGYFRQHAGRAVYFISGRLKEVIIRSGEKFSPIAIEKKICEKAPEASGRLVVLGFPHRDYGEEVGAYLENAPDELRERVLTAIRALPLEMRPKILLHGARPIPRTHTGKVQRRKLQGLFAAYADCRGQTRAVALES